MSLSLSCVADLSALSDGSKEESHEAALPRVFGYSGVFFFVGHGWRQHKEFRWPGTHNLHHYDYMVPSSYNMKEAIRFAYRPSFAVDQTPAMISGKGG